jgi:hypothetical protein
MSISDTKLTLSGNAELLEKFAGDFEHLANVGANNLPTQRKYIIKEKSDDFAERKARKAALSSLGISKLKKIAFDTRRIDQETERNPRSNLQYWNRSDQFINEEMQDKLNTFSKLMTVLKEIKASYGTAPEWHESYARVLHDNVERILRLKIGDQDIFGPQISYLEQLVFARYRLSMEEITKFSSYDLSKRILDKDENLLKRGIYLAQTGGFDKESSGQNSKLIIDGKSNNTQQNIIEAIFGNPDLRRNGERSVERTITITIRDEVKD